MALTMFFFGYSLYLLFAVLFLLTILEKTSGVAAMKGFNSNHLRVTPLFSISFRDYLFIDASSHS